MRGVLFTLAKSVEDVALLTRKHALYVDAAGSTGICDSVHFVQISHVRNYRKYKCLHPDWLEELKKHPVKAKD